MEIHIAENLRRLRRERGITQEELAGFVGVSAQAVSKWETGSGLPDLPLLPTLASFFDVSIDALMGMDEIKNAERREELRKQARAAYPGKPREAAALFSEILTIYPEDYEIMNDLADALWVVAGQTFGDEHEKTMRQIVELYERILAHCTDIALVNRVSVSICHALHHLGENEEAIRRAEVLPQDERLDVMVDLTEGVHRTTWCQEKIHFSLAPIEHAVNRITEGEYYTLDEKIRLLEKIPAMYALFYDDGDYYEAYSTVSGVWWRINHLHLKAGRVDEAFAALGECARLAALIDRLDTTDCLDDAVHSTSPDFPGRHPYTSPLFNRIAFIAVDNSGSKLTCSGKYAHAIRQMPEFDGVRDDPRLEAILTFLDDTHAECLAKRNQ